MMVLGVGSWKAFLPALKLITADRDAINSHMCPHKTCDLLRISRTVRLDEAAISETDPERLKVHPGGRSRSHHDHPQALRR
jgi:hypothetical protein